MRVFLYLLVTALILAQFFRPTRNLGVVRGTTHISQVYPVPANVEAILEKACYDCHSNNTRYPWYARVQPFGWWLAGHVADGKEELNFSEFTNLPPETRAHKLEEIIEQVEHGAMPLRSYTLLHRDANLTQAEKETLLNWARPGSAKGEEKHPQPAETQ